MTLAKYIRRKINESSPSQKIITALAGLEIVLMTTFSASNIHGYISEKNLLNDLYQKGNVDAYDKAKHDSNMPLYLSGDLGRRIAAREWR